MGLKSIAKKATASASDVAGKYGGLTLGGVSIAGLFGFIILIVQQVGPIWASLLAWQQAILLTGGFLTIFIVIAAAGYLILFGRQYGINPVQAIKDLMDIVNLLKNSGVLTPVNTDDNNNPITPPPTPPTPNPKYPMGVTIGLFSLGKGQFVAALIDPVLWKAGGGRIEMRNWKDNEALYTILVSNAQGLLEYENQAMYRLEDNTCISLVPDPFATKPAPEETIVEKYNKMYASDKPLRYFLDYLVPSGTDMTLLMLECVYGIARAPTMYELYKNRDPAMVAYVEKSLIGVVENMAANDEKSIQLKTAQTLFGKYVGKVPGFLAKLFNVIMR
jgi:hypothetical protein